MKQKIKRVPIISQLMKGKIDDDMDLIQLDGQEDANTFTIQHVNGMLSKIGKPHIHLVTSSFLSAIYKNIDSFINNKEVFMSIEPVQGIIMINSRIICYDILKTKDDYGGRVAVFSEKGQAMLMGDAIIDPKEQKITKALCMINPTYESYLIESAAFQGLERSKIRGASFREYISFIVSFHILKKYSQVETKILEPHSKVKAFNCKYYNDTDHQIEIMDSTWFTTLVKSDEFKVRGHFRFQACGQAFKDKKLIWIKDFKKEGYTRKARKELEIA
jgi:hypothetical protein